MCRPEEDPFTVALEPAIESARAWFQKSRTHRHLGPGLLESTHQQCFARELRLKHVEVLSNEIKSFVL
jgi:hypothetical protein